MLVVGVNGSGRDRDEGRGNEDLKRLGFFWIWVSKWKKTYGEIFIWIFMCSGEGEQGKHFKFYRFFDFLVFF